MKTYEIAYINFSNNQLVKRLNYKAKSLDAAKAYGRTYFQKNLVAIKATMLVKELV